MQASDEDDGSDTGSDTSVEEEPNTTNAAPGPAAFIHDKSKRRSTFKKRKAGLMRKAYELSMLTGTQVLVLAVSENGHLYTYTTAKLQPLVSQPEGRNLIQSYLNIPFASQASASSSNNDNTLDAQNAAGSSASTSQSDISSSSTRSRCATDVPKIDVPTNTRYVRSTQFWLSDGNIVLATKLHDPHQCDSCPHHVLFRVHKSVLAMQSEVFEHMLGSASSLGTEETINEMYEGLPIVEMSDSTDQVFALLEVLYGWISLPYKHFDPRARNTSQLVLEIAEKYQMTNICQRIVAHIEDYWPTTLAAWDIFEAQLQLIRDDDRRDDEVDYYAQEPAGAINLARRYNVIRILPTAFYDLSRIPANCDLTVRRARAEDAPEDDMDFDTWNARAAFWTTLDVADYHRVCLGRERLRERGKTAITRALHACPAKSCYNIARCRDMSLKSQAEARKECYSTYDVLKVLKELGENVAVCPGCKEEIKNDIQMHRSAIWRDLSGIFSL